MPSEGQKRTAVAFIDEIMTEGNLEKINEFVTPDFTYHSRGETINGANNFKQWILSDRDIFSNIQYTIMGTIAELDRVVTAFIIDAIHDKSFRGIPATHKKFETAGVSIFQFQGDKIRTVWTIIDGLTPAIELGVVKLSTPYAEVT